MECEALVQPEARTVGGEDVAPQGLHALSQPAQPAVCTSSQPRNVKSSVCLLERQSPLGPPPTS